MQVKTLAPTVLGLGSVSPQTGDVPVATAAPASQALVLPVNYPLNLDAQQTRDIQARVEKFDLGALHPQVIAQEGQTATDNLNRVLSGFLDRIAKNEHPQVFKLVDALSDSIEKQRIGELTEKILSAKPGLVDRFIGLFSKKSLQRAMDRVYEDLSRAARAKSKTLNDVIEAKEKELAREKDKLEGELRVMDSLKDEYRKSFVEFCVEVAYLYSALEKAKQQVPALLERVGNDISAQQEIHDKLQLLESVALSRETMMTRLPAEQIMVRQLQNAGVSTLQELTVTMGDRFASIRTTLLGIHGANVVRNVQRLGEANARLDDQLQAARNKLMGTVVKAAANAPGDNRLAQAKNLQEAIASTQELQKAVEEARETNRAKFAEARTVLSEAREDLLELGQKINPAARFAG